MINYSQQDKYTLPLTGFTYENTKLHFFSDGTCWRNEYSNTTWELLKNVEITEIINPRKMEDWQVPCTHLKFGDLHPIFDVCKMNENTMSFLVHIADGFYNLTVYERVAD